MLSGGSPVTSASQPLVGSEAIDVEGSAKVVVDLGPSGGASKPPTGKPNPKPLRPKGRSPVKGRNNFGLPHPSTLLSKPTIGSLSTSPRGSMSFNMMALNVAAVIALWAFYDWLQEMQFKQDGYTYGNFSIFVVQALCAASSLIKLAWRMRQGFSAGAIDDPSGKGNLTRPLLGHVGRSGIETSGDFINLVCNYLAIAGFMISSGGLYNTALKYSSEAVKTAFKATKLLPTLAVATLLGNASYMVLDYIIATFIVAGFMVFHAADSQPLETSHWLGPFTLTLAVFFDAMTPNVEEMMLRRMGRCKQEMILVTQGLRALVSGITVASTGELMSGHRWLASQKTWQPLGLLALQALVAYAGIYLYLVLLMNAGSKVTVIATSCRTILAGSLRVLLLLRPGNWKHAFGLLLLGAGLAGNNRWGTADGPPVRHRRIIDIGAILAPGLGRLRTLTMEQMERMGNVRGNSRGEPKP